MWGEYSRELDKEIVTTIFKALGIEKDVKSTEIQLTEKQLEKIGQRFKKAGEALKRWQNAAKPETTDRQVT